MLELSVPSVPSLPSCSWASSWLRLDRGQCQPMPLNSKRTDISAFDQCYCHSVFPIFMVACESLIKWVINTRLAPNPRQWIRFAGQGRRDVTIDGVILPKFLESWLIADTFYLFIVKPRFMLLLILSSVKVRLRLVFELGSRSVWFLFSALIFRSNSLGLCLHVFL